MLDRLRTYELTWKVLDDAFLKRFAALVDLTVTALPGRILWKTAAGGAKEHWPPVAGPLFPSTHATVGIRTDASYHKFRRMWGSRRFLEDMKNAFVAVTGLYRERSFHQ